MLETPTKDASTTIQGLQGDKFMTDENYESNKRLLELGYQVEFRREMSFFGVLGMSFCAIGILTGMSSAFQTGLFSGGPLGESANFLIPITRTLTQLPGLFWGWNVRPLSRDRRQPLTCSQICSFFMLLIALSLAEICSA